MEKQGQSINNQQIIKNKLSKKLLGKDKKLRTQILKTQKQNQATQKNIKLKNFFESTAYGYLEADENEQTLQFRQESLKPLLPMKNAANIFSLDLDFGSYNIDYTRDGKHLLLGSSLGHIALMNWQYKKLLCEFHVKEKINDVAFLQSERLYAVAQKKYLYIYDNDGIEIHRLKYHLEPKFLEYLPYHYLLVSMSRLGFLKYQDISTGQIASEFRTTIREPTSMNLNQSNGIITVGESKGTVQMYSPNQHSSIVKMLCHKSGVQSISSDRSGNYLVTMGLDGFMKIWDLRTYKQLYDYWIPTQCKSSSISQTGILALSCKSVVYAWKDWHIEKQKKPYMKEVAVDNKLINDIKFCPYEDFLGLGLEKGFSSIIIPGSGEASYDGFEVNIFSTKKQRQEAEVHKLLDKLPASSIMIKQQQIGQIDDASADVINKEKKIEREEKERQAELKKKKKKKKKSESVLAKKNEFVTDDKTRERIRLENATKLKIKRAEKQKAKQEAELLNTKLNEFVDFDPISTLKKVKKQ